MEPDVKTFSLLDTLAENKYPEDSVTVYTDTVALYEYDALNSEANDSQDPDSFDERLGELREQIKASAYTFHLKGFPPKVRKGIMALARAQFKIDSDAMIMADTPAFRWVSQKSLAVSLVKVVSPDGAEDHGPFDVDYVDGLEDWLEPEEFGKIADKTFELSFRSLAFDAAVTPDFS